MAEETIRSAQNPLVKRIRTIKSRKGRARERVCWVEGLAPVLEAIDAGWPIETLVLASDMLRSDAAASRLTTSDAPIRHVSGEVFERISDRDGPTGLGAIVKTRDQALGALEIVKDTLLVILDSPQDPGNLGSILRTAYSLGVDGLVLLGNSVDPFDSRAIRASMGAVFRVPVVRERRHEGLIEWAKRGGLQLVGTSARGTISYREVDYRFPTGIVVGNEQKGLDEDIAKACDVLAAIPMQGTISSLNLSAAAAIVLNEAAHRCGRHG
jgi:TrmH family RNA methyltransferase